MTSRQMRHLAYDVARDNGLSAVEAEAAARRAESDLKRRRDAGFDTGDWQRGDYVELARAAAKKGGTR